MPLPYYSRMEKRMVSLLPGGLHTGLANTHRMPQLPWREGLLGRFPASFWLDTVNTNEYLVGHAGLHKLQGLTQETEANIRFLQCRTEEFLVTQGYFTFNFVFRSHLKSPKTHQCNYASRKTCNYTKTGRC